MADNASITILRNTQANINAEPIKDGNILFTTDQAENKIYADVGTTRIKIGGTVDVDTTLSTTSTNPVQNKVITNSVNDVRGQIHTNLLNLTAPTQTINGVTFTNNGDGTYTLNGICSATAYNVIWSKSADRYKGKHLRLCGCPSGGASDTYQLVVFAYDADGTYIRAWYNQSYPVESIVPQSAVRLECHIYVYTSVTVNNLLFKPMLTTDLDATYDDFVPYTGDSGRLNEDVAKLVDSVKGISSITNSEIDTILNS